MADQHDDDLWRQLAVHAHTYHSSDNPHFREHYASLVAKHFADGGAANPLQETFERENVPAAVVSPKPGEKYGQIAPQDTKSTKLSDRIEAITRAAMPILESPEVKNLMAKHFGIKNYKVTPTTGTWEKKVEPSFVITAPNMTPVKAKRMAAAFGMGLWQDAAVHRVHNPNIDLNSGSPTLIIGHGKTLKPEEREAILASAAKHGHDLTFSTDNKAAIFTHYGEPEEHEQFLNNVKSIAKEAKMPQILAVRTSGDLNGSETYVPQILGRVAKRTRDQRSPTEPSDLFTGLVDHILTPFTKAASEHGYRFSPERFADHHKLTDVERNYLYSKLIPPERKAVSGFGRTTIDQPVGYEYPGVYGDPRRLVEEAVSRVAEESPAMKRLFGVTRGDLFHINANRVGNMEPVLKMSPSPRGSEAAQKVMTPRNEQRLIDILTEAGKHEKLIHGMDPWYVMDPLYHRMVELMGKDKAKEQYTKLNTLVGMASPGSEVPTEINRGLAAYYLQNQGRFKDFVNYGGLPEHARGADFPADIADIMGHPYHSTSQAGPMARYLESGKVEMGTPKVPTYIPASGVPDTGFQTRFAVPDAHYTRIIGMGEARKSSEPGVSMKMPEYQAIAPWHREKLAAPMGMEAVPTQARLWGAGSGATGVSSPIGAPKLEMLANHIMERAAKHGISPEQARDQILQGKLYAKGGAISKDKPQPVHPAMRIPGVHIVTAEAGEPFFHGDE